MKEIVLSGIRPTGNLHLGNYYGAVQNFVKMQEDYNCYYFIADWHSLTTHPKPEDIQQSARTILADTWLVASTPRSQLSTYRVTCPKPSSCTSIST